jgi:hypothetical protein
MPKALSVMRFKVSERWGYRPLVLQRLENNLGRLRFY